VALSAESGRMAGNAASVEAVVIRSFAKIHFSVFNYYS